MKLKGKESKELIIPKVKDTRKTKEMTVLVMARYKPCRKLTFLT